MLKKSIKSPINLFKDYKKNQFYLFEYKKLKNNNNLILIIFFKNFCQ